jgi:hypothetical protein
MGDETNAAIVFRSRSKAGRAFQTSSKVEIGTERFQQ